MHVTVWIELSGTLRSEISNIVCQFSKKYKVYANQMEWRGPHITLVTFKINEQGNHMFQEIVNSSKVISRRIRSFRITINGMGYFRKSIKGKTNYVIYLKVGKSRKLDLLRSAILSKFRRYNANKGRKFSPHITIAYEDLTKKKFYAALKEYRNLKFSRSFLVNYIKINTSELDKRHRRKVKTIKL